MISSEPRPRNSKSGSRKGTRSTRSFRRPLPWCGRPHRRTLGERHYDVQLIGGIVLHEGKIAEMATGEGKTLVSTLPPT